MHRLRRNVIRSDGIYVQAAHSSKLGSCFRKAVLILSLVALFGRIVHAVYATYFLYSTFNCVPCLNETDDNENNTLENIDVNTTFFRNVESRAQAESFPLFLIDPRKSPKLTAQVKTKREANNSEVIAFDPDKHTLLDELEELLNESNAFFNNEKKSKNSSSQPNDSSFSKESNGTIVNPTEAIFNDTEIPGIIESNFTDEGNKVRGIFVAIIIKNNATDYPIVAKDGSNASKEGLAAEEPCSDQCTLPFHMPFVDPKDRQSALIFYAIFCMLNAIFIGVLFLGTCFLFLKLIVLAVVYEGFRLLSLFVWLCLDSSRGRNLNLKVISIDIGVDPDGLGWNIRLHYGDYLLDILIFLMTVAMLMCIQKGKKRLRAMNEIEPSLVGYRRGDREVPHFIEEIE